MKILADKNIPFAADCFSSIGEVKVVDARGVNPEMLNGIDVLLVRSVLDVNEKLLVGSKVQFVATATIGFDHVDRDYLSRMGIGFASAPGSNANSVAEYVVAALLEVAGKREISLEEKSIGIIGVGNVGTLVEKKCTALGMKPLLNDPPLFRQTGDKKYRPIEDLFGCDFITLHVPLSLDGQDKTFHLADSKFFESLKNNPVFINTSRGAVVDTCALKNAIKTEKIKAVILDVWEDEPNIDTELLEMVDICTAHIAGYSFDGKVAGMIMIYKAVCSHFGLEPKYNDADAFLPTPETSELKVQTKGYTDQQIVKAVINEIYKISEDDKRLRTILNMPLGKRCARFDRLRKEYPVRREFQNTEITLATEGTEILKDKLKGIGFKV